MTTTFRRVAAIHCCTTWTVCLNAQYRKALDSPQEMTVLQSSLELFLSARCHSDCKAEGNHFSTVCISFLGPLFMVELPLHVYPSPCVTSGRIVQREEVQLRCWVGVPSVYPGVCPQVDECIGALPQRGDAVPQRDDAPGVRQLLARVRDVHGFQRLPGLLLQQ